ncbi:MAG: hypothetical protein JWP42_4582 [Pseudomonas sp.]|nr:hypothetical protein [Pseudomonas sp.]
MRLIVWPVARRATRVWRPDYRIRAVTQVLENIAFRAEIGCDTVVLSDFSKLLAIPLRDGCDLMDVMGRRLRAQAKEGVKTGAEVLVFLFVREKVGCLLSAIYPVHFRPEAVIDPELHQANSRHPTRITPAHAT